MKSVVKSITRRENLIYIIFKKDDTVIKNLEKVFQKFKPRFKFQKYKKPIGGRPLDFLYESKKDINFSLAVKKTVIRLKIREDEQFNDKFMKLLDKDIEFAKISSKAKERLKKSH